MPRQVSLKRGEKRSKKRGKKRSKKRSRIQKGQSSALAFLLATPASNPHRMRRTRGAYNGEATRLRSAPA